jgi:long-chain acyl-CoA synthetase
LKIIGGGNVAMGYYKHPDKTKEEFYIENEKRWFKVIHLNQL